VGSLKRIIEGADGAQVSLLPKCVEDYAIKVNKMNPFTYMTYLLSHVRDVRVTLLTPDESNANELTQIG